MHRLRRLVATLGVAMVLGPLTASAAHASPPDGTPASCQGYLSSNEARGGRAFVASVLFKQARAEFGVTGRQFYAEPVAQARPGSLAACRAIIGQ